MTLMNRLIGSPEEGKIGIGGFIAGLNLVALGVITRSDLVNEYDLTKAEQAELDVLKGHYDGAANKEKYLSGLYYMLVAAEDGGRFGLNSNPIFMNRLTAIKQ